MTEGENDMNQTTIETNDNDGQDWNAAAGASAEAQVRDVIEDRIREHTMLLAGEAYDRAIEESLATWRAKEIVLLDAKAATKVAKVGVEEAVEAHRELIDTKRVTVKGDLIRRRDFRDMSEIVRDADTDEVVDSGVMSAETIDAHRQIPMTYDLASPDLDSVAPPSFDEEPDSTTNLNGDPDQVEVDSPEALLALAEGKTVKRGGRKAKVS